MRNRNIQGPILFSAGAKAPSEFMPYGKSLSWRARLSDSLWADIWVLYLCSTVSVPGVSLDGIGYPPSEPSYFPQQHLRFQALPRPRMAGKVDAVCRTILHPLPFSDLHNSSLMLVIIPALQIKNLKLACYKIRLNRIFAKGQIVNILGLVGLCHNSQRCCCSMKAEIDTK